MAYDLQNNDGCQYGAHARMCACAHTHTHTLSAYYKACLFLLLKFLFAVIYI